MTSYQLESESWKMCLCSSKTLEYAWVRSDIFLWILQVRIVARWVNIQQSIILFKTPFFSQFDEFSMGALSPHNSTRITPVNIIYQTIQKPIQRTNTRTVVPFQDYLVITFALLLFFCPHLKNPTNKRRLLKFHQPVLRLMPTTTFHHD